MTKEGYHGVTLNNAAYSILSELSKTMNKSFSDTICSVLTGNKVVYGILFEEERVCLNCGCRPGSNVGKCPGCGSVDSIITRYIKSSKKRIESCV